MHAPLIRTLMNVLSPAGSRARLSILIFHRVPSEPDSLFPEEPDISQFDRICQALQKWCNVLPLSHAIERIKTSSLPARAACITFDDGYSDNCRNALPVLSKYGLHATFFVATGFLNGGRMWNDTLIESVRATPHESIDLTDMELGRLRTQSFEDKRAALAAIVPALKHLERSQREDAVASVASRCGPAKIPNDLMMTDDEVCALHAAGMEIGAHTVNHPILARCAEPEASREIADGRATLESLIGERVGLFAYPNGKLGRDYTHEHVRLVRDLGFDAAVSTNPGASADGDDLFQLRRFTPWDREIWRFGLRLARNLT